MLPLLERGLHAYTFTDVSAGFFPGALQKLAAFPEVECKIFDLEKPGTDQDLAAGSFDFIIGTNVLHAVSDVRATLGHLHDLLAPGGSLVFMDTATPQLWTETVFGLTSGWWRFTDRDLRPHQPLLERAQWERVLTQAGFGEATSLPGLIGPSGGEGQIGLFARKAWQQPATAAAPVETPAEKSWLIFADASGLGEQLATQLRAAGAHCRIARPGNNLPRPEPTLSPCARKRRRIGRNFSQPARPQHRSSESSTSGGSTHPRKSRIRSWAPTLCCTSARRSKRRNPGGKVRIDAVTRGAQPVGRETAATTVAQAPGVGLFRVILNEYSEPLLPRDRSAAGGFRVRCRLALERTAARTTPSAKSPSVAKPATRNASREDVRPSSSRSIRRCRCASSPASAATSTRCASRRSPLPPCGPGEVLIDVKAAGMNFRDVLKALALYPGEAPDARIFGDEVGGVVKAVGAGVKHVAPGDRVFGLAVFGLATQTLARGGDVRRIPGKLSFEEAATLPVVFMTSWHALKNVAHLRAGECILVHAGAGGVGMAAIQIAHHLGAEVIASAGSATKRALLKTLGVKHVIDSRRGDFAEAVMELTGRRGVDVVLNALAAEAIPMGLSCLAEFGRFIEIGKRDIYQNSRIPLWSLRRNASFHVVAMDAVFSGDEALTREMLGELAGLVEKGALTPLPFRSFPASRIDAAFRLMASGKHIGKVVVSFPEAFVPRRGEPLAPPFAIKPDGCYLITGAFGGFGKVLAEWLVKCGARHLVLSSRSGAATPAAEAFVQSLRDRGVNAKVVRADAGSAEDVSRLLAEIRAGDQPLRGVFHLAMVIDDAPLAALNRERLRTVMAPKAYGAWLLHKGTQRSPARLLRHVLVHLQHLWESGAGQLRRGQCLPRLARPSPSRARPARADHELGRARRRRLRRAQRTRRRIPRAAGHDGTLTG